MQALAQAVREEQSLAPASLIALENVSIAYEDTDIPVLHDINFTLNEGESVLFLGPSGCGKSTLAMLCAKLLPRSVEATVSGDVKYSSVIDEPGQIGYVFQDPDAQFALLTVADEIAFGLENRQIPPEAMPARIREALKQAGLNVALTANHAEFSGGMKQKLAIASALALSPRLLILDEPTANLDPLSTRQVFDQIEQMHRQGQTLLVIEHKFDRLLDFMDRVVLFDRTGTIYRSGPTQKVICEEWSWLVQEGVVAPWKSPPAKCPEHLSSVEISKIMMPVTSSLAATEELAYELKNVTIGYKRQTVIRDISLTVPKGALVAIVGPNGAGKSTLLQVLAGLKKASAGSVTLFGHPISEWPPRKRFSALAYSFQNPEFQFIYERVGDELANRIVADQVPDHVLNLLKEFGLDGLEQHSPFALSQGQKRRLSVASMLRNEHDLYLFDEPTFGQDAKTQQALMERMKTLHRSGKTMILTTHDMDLVRHYADLVIVVAKGRVLFTGTPTALFSESDILRQAHLLADREGDAPATTNTPVTNVLKKIRTPLSKLHPGWLFLSMFAAAMVSLFAYTLPQAAAEISLPLVVMMGLGWMTPWRILKLLSPFLVFYVLYLWSFFAYAAVPPGVHTVNILWYHLSPYGFQQGLIISIRMLGSVLFGILFVTQIDFTDFMVALCKDFHVPPKFAYGTMAGLRVVPLFSSEWTKLRQARQIRGKDASVPWLRPVTYAMPILSQGVRMSERVAIAMEARGFFDKVTESAKYRTFYRHVVAHWWDFFISLTIVTLAVMGLTLLH